MLDLLDKTRKVAFILTGTYFLLADIKKEILIIISVTPHQIKNCFSAVDRLVFVCAPQLSIFLPIVGNIH